ncbi:hypothetical protein BZG82_05675 [Salinivibrio sp. PR5]|uniref:zonular occludens toxin domain-containing protein n=1 Tax=Salinivibrio sp. PR5 TaxID=1909484 RepID=UPI00098BCD1C|nr:zonular occludens toxin domain-containing protein [Salinivibrio sp. PR5]OOF11103.1 hypothetical protein BZG82_05675 [Salinivibrio sp. PR5]
MLYGFSGLPGAGKTLNAVKFTCEESVFQGRQRYYHGVPLLFFDYDVCDSFKGWFYGVFMPSTDNQLIHKKVKRIHKEDRYAELSDFPFLANEYEKHQPFALWLKWIKRCYPASALKEIRDVCTMLEIPEHELTFAHVEHLNLHWTQFDNPHKWHELPHESVIVIDEIQDIWGTRSAGTSVPKAVEEYATHRHKGFDLVLISQDFRDCDVFIRRRIGNHKHYLNYGLKYLKVWEDHKLIPTDDSKALWRLGSKKITKDKRFFGVYLSAVLHTHKPKLPRKVKLALYVAAFSFCAMAAGILFLVNKFTSDTPETAISDTVTHSETATLSDNSLANTDFKLFTPRVDALPFTAPVFDDRIARGELDIPQLFCYAVDMSCKCYTQQGTRYSVSHSECLNIAQFGTFNYFKNQDERTR